MPSNRYLLNRVESKAREITIENTLAVLTARFTHADVNVLKSMLEPITDLDRLKALHVRASLMHHKVTFLHLFDTSQFPCYN